MQRAAVLEDIIRTVPPEVAGQVETISKEEAKLVSGPRPGLRRSQTSTIDVWGHAEDGAAATGAPSDITLQRRCAQLESQLDKWVRSRRSGEDELVEIMNGDPCRNQGIRACDAF
jgi:hypothetical protein